jgi:DNA-binding GntR family transcriptional regulator
MATGLPRIDLSSRETLTKDHLPIFEAIERGDREAAIAAMAAHMESASARLKATMQQSAWSEPSGEPAEG